MADSQLAFTNWLSQGNKFIPQLGQQQLPLNYSFDEEFRRKKINKLVSMLHSRKNEIAVNLVADWAEKTEDYICRNIQQRNGHKNRRHIVDVLKFLCDTWNWDYPKEYYDYGQKAGIVKERV